MQWWFHFSRFWQASFAKYIHLTFWCYLIDLSVVYSQRFGANGFSRLIASKKSTEIKNWIILYLRNNITFSNVVQEAYLGFCQTSMMEFFAKIVNG